MPVLLLVLILIFAGPVYSQETASLGPSVTLVATAPPLIAPAPEFHWKGATVDSFKFLMVQTGARLTLQAKTRRALSGPFVKDYIHTLSMKPSGFMDGDSWMTNFIGHPIEGATAYHIATGNGASHLQGFVWSVLYSTNFELGPLGEAGIGNVQISPVDLVVTPTAGYLLGRTEDWISDRIGAHKDSRAVRFARLLLVGRQLARLTMGH